MRPLRSIMVAVDDHNVIGKDGTIPWHLPDDLKRFKDKRLGNTLIVGRKTALTFPKLPLPGSNTIVVSSMMEPRTGIVVCKTLEEAVQEAERFGREIIFAGGQRIYAEALPITDRIYFTHVPGVHDGDTFFPAIHKDEWMELGMITYNGFTAVTYERRR